MNQKQEIETLVRECRSAHNSFSYGAVTFAHLERFLNLEIPEELRESGRMADFLKFELFCTKVLQFIGVPFNKKEYISFRNEENWLHRLLLTETTAYFYYKLLLIVSHVNVDKKELANWISKLCHGKRSLSDPFPKREKRRIKREFKKQKVDGTLIDTYKLNIQMQEEFERYPQKLLSAPELELIHQFLSEVNHTKLMRILELLKSEKVGSYRNHFLSAKKVAKCYRMVAETNKSLYNELMNNSVSVIFNRLRKTRIKNKPIDGKGLFAMLFKGDNSLPKYIISARNYIFLFEISDLFVMQQFILHCANRWEKDENPIRGIMEGEITP